MSNISRRPDTGVPLYGLYLGSKNGEAWQKADRDAVFVTVSKHFENFTVSEAAGCCGSRPVPTLILWIGTRNAESVMQLAGALGRLTEQTEIGVEVYGRYRTVKINQD